MGPASASDLATLRAIRRDKRLAEANPGRTISVPMEAAMNRSTQRIAPNWVFALVLSLSVLGVLMQASSASAQARGEVIDPFTAEPTASHSELLDPFADTPRTRRTAATPRTQDLLDPFSTTARRVVHYLAELLDPWSD